MIEHIGCSYRKLPLGGTAALYKVVCKNNFGLDTNFMIHVSTHSNKKAD